MMFVWDIERGCQFQQPWQAHAKTVSSVCWSQKDEAILVSGSNDGNVNVWDCHNGFALVTRLEGHVGRVTCVDVMPVKEPFVIASGGEDCQVRIWHTSYITASTLKKSQELEHGFNLAHFILRGHNHAVKTLKFNPSGRLLASGSEDMDIRIWNIQGKNHTLNCVFKAHEYAFSKISSGDNS